MAAQTKMAGNRIYEMIKIQNLLQFHQNRAFSHELTAAIWVFQTYPVGVEFFSYVTVFFCFNKFALILAMWVKTLRILRRKLSYFASIAYCNGGRKCSFSESYKFTG